MERTLRQTRQKGKNALSLKQQVLSFNSELGHLTGEGFDLLVIDEAQEYTVEQETALKYTVSDSDNPMTIMLGTPPTEVSTGTVFENYRKDVLKGNKKYSGWPEWSVDAVKDIHDTDSWYLTNPSMGYH